MAIIRRNRPLIDLFLSYGDTSTSLLDKADLWEQWKDYSSSRRDDFTSSSEAYPHRLVSHATALHYACMVGDMDVVEVLLRKGANWEKEDERGVGPGGYCCGKEDAEVWKRLLEEEKGRREERKKEEEEAKGKEEKPKPGEDKKGGDDEDSDDDDSDKDEDKQAVDKKPKSESSNKSESDTAISYTLRKPLPP
jgi:ATP-dependent Clp protease ATP-binding subunit ClpB